MFDREDIPHLLDNYHLISIKKSEKKQRLMEYFTEHSINLETRTQFGGTMLIYVAMRGYLDILQILLEMGADKDAMTEFKDTALNWAAYKGHADCVGELIRVKADLEIVGYGTHTALTSAVMENKKDCVKLLLAAGASIRSVPPKIRFLIYDILEVIHRCDQRDPDFVLALTKLCDQYAAFSESEMKEYGLENNILLQAINYIAQLNEFSRIYKENSFLYLDLATHLYLPTVIIDLILQYDRDSQAPLHDERLENFSSGELSGYLDHEIDKNHCLLKEVNEAKPIPKTTKLTLFEKDRHGQDSVIPAKFKQNPLNASSR